MKYADLIDKFVGPVNPIGETNEDDRRFENLKLLCDLTHLTIDKLVDVRENSKNREEYSIKRAFHLADEALRTIHSEISEL